MPTIAEIIELLKNEHGVEDREAFKIFIGGTNWYMKDFTTFQGSGKTEHI
jgi:hypothetical protein